MGTVRVGELEVAEDYAFQRREWVVQRVAWVVGGLVLLLAFTGLLGDGPYSDGTVGNADLEVGYERIARHQSPARLQIEVAADAVREGTVRIWIDQDYLAGIELQQIVPEPASAVAEPGRVVYEFEVGGTGPALVTFETRPEGLGFRSGRLGVDGGEAVTFRQFVLP